MAAKLLLVGTAEVPAALPYVGKFLVQMAAGSDGRFAAEDIGQALCKAEMQLWAILQGSDVIACLVTQVQDYPRCKVLRLVGLAGKGWKAWMHLRSEVEAWAKSIGCTKVEALALHKMRHLLPDLKPWHLMFTKDL